MTTIDDPPTLNPDRVPIGIDSYDQWLDLRFSGIENPHILVCGGSQTGKTTLQVLIAAAAASRGTIVVILDPKQRFSRPFRNPQTEELLPHVLVYEDADDYVAPREWQGILDLIIAEMQGRYRADKQGRRGVLSDRQRFPNVLVVADELGVLLDFADKEWPYRKPDGYKGGTPVRELIHTMTRMGAEARVFGCFANQTPREDELPAGTKTRTLCGQRIFLGPIQEPAQWRMLAGESTTQPDIPENQKGAGAVLFNNGKPVRFQAGFLDWNEHPEQVYNMAARGLPILRQHGHVDERDRLTLAGVQVPPPGKMSSHVTGSRIDLLNDDSEDEAPSEQTSAPSVAAVSTPQEHPEPERMVTGNAAAAEFCGMSTANFRKVRDLHPIEGEMPNADGNKPGWYESDLRMWKLRHGQRRGKRNQTTQKGTA